MAPRNASKTSSSSFRQQTQLKIVRTIEFPDGTLQTSRSTGRSTVQAANQHKQNMIGYALNAIAQTARVSCYNSYKQCTVSDATYFFLEMCLTQQKILPIDTTAATAHNCALYVILHVVLFCDSSINH